jgi:protein-tyrosine phosphatase
MRGYGVDLAPHRSREATAAELRAADLVLGMAREHVRDAAALDPEALCRTFTLKELVRRGAAIGPRPPTEPVADWLARAAAGRRARDLLGSSPDDDVRDPIGLSRAHYEAVAGEVAALVHRMVDLLWPRARPDPHAEHAGRSDAP